jgi:TonB-linked SusC/RagA family outer membrane protein
MKNLTKQVGKLYPHIKKGLLIMRLSILLILIAVFTSSASVYSQATKLTIKMENARLSEVFDAIEKQSEFYFFYNRDYFNDERIVSVDFEDKLVEEVLKELFKNEAIKYEIYDRNILLTISDAPLTTAQQEVMQQQRAVSGKVTDSSGLPLPGVTVVVKGTTQGTVTNADGDYTLTNIQEDATLVFSFVGMRTQEVVVEDQTTINVTMMEDLVGIEEVVAVGYGTMKKGNLTGSISSVKSEKLVKNPVGTTSNVLVGRLPGLITKQSGGQPGQDAAALSIRGFGSPLVIVDGVEAELNNINPHEIESISVLKDASAAIYGARAGNGVILVTTKRGKEGKPTLTLNSTYSLQGVTSFGKPVNAGQYAELIREAHLNAGLPESTSRFSEEDIQKYYEGTDPGYPNANWWKEIMNKWTPQQQHNLSISGGSEKIKYFGSFGFLNQELMYKAGGNYYQRYNIRSNIDANITDNFSIKLDFVDIVEIRKYPNRSDYLIWEDLFNAEPVRYSSFPDKTKVPITGQQLMNPIIDTNRDIGGYRDNEGHSIKSNFELNYRFKQINGLFLKAMINYSQNFSFQKDFQKQALLWNWDYQSDTYWVEANTPETRLNHNDAKSRTITGQFSLNYERTINDNHYLNALFLYELIDYRDSWIAAQRREFITNSIDYLFAGGEGTQYANGAASETGRSSYIGRLNYAFKNKYLIESTFRFDASAKFAPEKRWGFFPSISAGWRLSEEPFFKDNLTWLKNLKLRSGFSQTGVDNFLNFQYLSGYTFGQTHLFGSELEKGLVSTGMANPGLSWEEMTIYNVGLDFALWKRKLYGEMDVFYRKREGMQAYRYATISTTFGETLPQENINSQNNRGFEVMLGHSDSSGDLFWDINGNVSWSRAKWDHYEEEPYTDPDQIRLSKRSGEWTDRIFGYKSDGLFTSQEEIDALNFEYPNGNSLLAPGDVKYIETNKDGVLDWRDQIELGTGEFPHWMFGIEMNLRYKKFDFSTLFQGAMGANVLVGLGSGSWVPQKYVFDERWTPENNDPNAIVPLRGGASSNNMVSDYNLKSSDYVRLKTLNIGYTFPSIMFSKASIQSLRVYFAGTNLFTFDKLKKYNLDPESSYSGDGLYYPQQRVLTLGVNLSF